MNNLTAYAMKSDAELWFIAADAKAAAEAMRGQDPAAESKYLDQVNDAFTILYRRAMKYGTAKPDPAAVLQEILNAGLIHGTPLCAKALAALGRS